MSKILFAQFDVRIGELKNTADKIKQGKTKDDNYRLYPEQKLSKNQKMIKH